jgi:hypothetical protein
LDHACYLAINTLFVPYQLFNTTGEELALKEIIPTSLDARQFLQLASLVEAQHFSELLNIQPMWFGMCPFR